MTTRTEQWVVILSSGKCDRFLSANGMAWTLDSSEADRMTRDQAERLAAEHGDGCRAERA